MKKLFLLISIFIGFPAGAACSPSNAAIEKALEQTRESDKATFTALAETQAAIPTSTPTLTLTPVPTVTPSPPPIQELLDVSLELSDLPPGYEELDPSELDINLDEFRSMFLEEDVTAGSVFIFFNPDQLHIMMGFIVFAQNRIDQSSFDFEIQNQDLATESFLSGLDMGEPEKIRIVEDLEYGDTAISFQLIYRDEDLPYRMLIDAAMFRRGIVIPFLFSFYPEQENPVIDINQLATTLDHRIIDILQIIG